MGVPTPVLPLSTPPSQWDRPTIMSLAFAEKKVEFLMFCSFFTCFLALCRVGVNQAPKVIKS